MALLGTWIDKASLQTIGGGGGVSEFFQTVRHFVATIGSGPAASTIPDTGIIVVRSVQSATAPGLPFYWGANASIATIGLAIGSTAAISFAPLVAVDVYNIYFHSPIR
jgi:hypothetical protein